MTERIFPDGASEAPAPTAAGAMLAAARIAAGLSVQDVSQQLKLAPRQVQWLESGDYDRLPGRTFVRGFVKNYARLLHLDPESVLAALPVGTGSALDVPILHPTAPTMGELPLIDRRGPSWARWAIPVTLAAIVAAAATYEWLRPSNEGQASATKVTPPRTEEAQPKVLTAPSSPPIAELRTDGVPHAQIEADAIPKREEFPAAAAPAPVARRPDQEAGVRSVDSPLTIVFRDSSWTEVRDRDGNVLLSGLNPAGTEKMLSGNPPLVIVIGNAADVTVTYRGQAVDLVPYTRQNVARLSLP